MYKKSIILRIIIAIILVALLLGYFFVLRDAPYSKGDINQDIIGVEIPMGSSTGAIGEILEENNIIDSASKFKIFSKIHSYDGKYVAGLYNLSPHMTKKEICEILISGDSDEETFTIPEGYTLEDIRDSLVSSGYIDADKFTEIIQSGDFSEFDFIPNNSDLKYRLEGYLFPATYKVPMVSEGEVMEEKIVYSMLEGFSNLFTEEMKARADELGLTVHEVLTIASIIEKEAISDYDRALVSSVIYNRLEEGMTLGMDTTILYVLDEHKVDITYDDMEIQSPYNTYKYPGLPPGPICNPGESAIKAALYPAESNYLYFVLSDALDGSVKFSETYEEFEIDVEKYYSARDGKK